MIDTNTLKGEIVKAAEEALIEGSYRDLPDKAKAFPRFSQIFNPLKFLDGSSKQNLFFGKILVPNFESVESVIYKPKWAGTGIYPGLNQVGVNIGIAEEHFDGLGLEDVLTEFEKTHGNQYRIEYNPGGSYTPHILLRIKKSSDGDDVTPQLVIKEISRATDANMFSDFIPAKWYDYKGRKNMDSKIYSLSENLDMFLDLVFNENTIRQY